MGESVKIWEKCIKNMGELCKDMGQMREDKQSLTQVCTNQLF